MAAVDIQGFPEFIPPRRPGTGVAGKSIKLRANHFPITFKTANLFHYEVSIIPDKCPRKVNR